MDEKTLFIAAADRARRLQHAIPTMEWSPLAAGFTSDVLHEERLIVGTILLDLAAAGYRFRWTRKEIEAGPGIIADPRKAAAEFWTLSMDDLLHLHVIAQDGSDAGWLLLRPGEGSQVVVDYDDFTAASVVTEVIHRSERETCNVRLSRRVRLPLSVCIVRDENEHRGEETHFVPCAPEDYGAMYALYLRSAEEGADEWLGDFPLTADISAIAEAVRLALETAARPDWRPMVEG